MDGAWAKLFGAFFDALGWVMEVFGLLGPLWLVVFFVMSIYQVMYRYAFLTLIAPVDTRFELLDPESTNITNAKGIGIAIIVILGFFKVHWVGSWLMALLITWVGDKHWQSATEGRLIEQGSGQSSHPHLAHTSVTDIHLGHPHDDVCVWEPNHRPRVCPVCERESSDRVYHCTRTDRCLPIYDHHCDWLQVSVYSRTMKSYLYTLLFLPLDTIGTFITLIVDLSSPTGKVDWPFGVSVLFTFTALIVGLALFGPKQWKHLAFRNEVFFEYRRPTKPILLGFKDARDARHPTLIFQLFVGNPWDRGTKRNLCQVLGSSWWMVSCPPFLILYTF